MCEYCEGKKDLYNKRDPHMKSSARIYDGCFTAEFEGDLDLGFITMDFDYCPKCGAPIGKDVEAFVLQEHMPFVSNVVSNAIHGTDKPESGWVTIATMRSAHQKSLVAALIREVRHGRYRIRALDDIEES